MRKALVTKPLGVVLQLGGAVSLVWGIAKSMAGEPAGYIVVGIALIAVYVGSRTKNRE